MKTADIPEQFVNVDFRAQKKFKTGLLPNEDVKERFAAMKAYEDVVTPIPSSQWVELAAWIENSKAGLEWLVKWILNQGQEGSCVGNAKTAQHHLVQAKQFGFDLVTQLSAISMYKQIGRSAQSGAYVPDAVDCAGEVGFLPLDTPTNREQFNSSVMPATGFSNRYPANWQATAKYFRDDEQYAAKTYEGLITALLRGDSAIIGRAGHSILYLGVRFTTKSVNSIRVPYQNSWGNWGVGMGNLSYGFGVDTYNYIRQSAGYAGLCRSVVIPSWKFKKK